MTIQTAESVQLSEGSGEDFGPGSDWQAFTQRLLSRPQLTYTGAIEMIGIVAGQLAIEDLGTEDVSEIHNATQAFEQTAMPRIGIVREHRQVFREGVTKAVEIAKVKEFVA